MDTRRYVPGTLPDMMKLHEHSTHPVLELDNVVKLATHYNVCVGRGAWTWCAAPQQHSAC